MALILDHGRRVAGRALADDDIAAWARGRGSAEATPRLNTDALSVAATRKPFFIPVLTPMSPAADFVLAFLDPTVGYLNGA
jgi:hypothetical protein